jgi:hypothetical protein
MQRAELKPVSNRLADYICAHRDEITELWINAVHRNPEIGSSENLTFRELVDHLPDLFDDLANRLRYAGSEKPKVEAERHSQEHGSHRWRQGYALDELLREIGIIRCTVFLDCVSKFGDENPEFTGEVRHEAKQVIHRFFNEMTIGSAQQFVEEQQSTIRRVNAELKASVEQLNDANRRLEEVGQSRLLLVRTVGHDLGNFLNAIGAAAACSREKPRSLCGRR